MTFNRDRHYRLLTFIALASTAIVTVSCGQPELAQQPAAGSVYVVEDPEYVERQDSLLTQKYSSILNVPFDNVKQSLPLYKFIDQQINTPCSNNPGENTTNDIALAQQLFKKVYKRKISGSYKELKHSNMIEKFSSQQYLAQGDLLFFEEKPEKMKTEGGQTLRINREPPERLVGIYLQNNHFITCAEKNGAVAINNLNEDYWKQRYKFAGRLQQ